MVVGKKVLVSVMMPCQEKLIIVCSRSPPTEDVQEDAEPQVSAWHLMPR